MKNLFACIALVVLFAMPFHKLSAQIIYDFYTKKIEKKPQSLKVGETVTVRVNNINTLLYTVNVTVDKKTYHTEPPALFLNYFPTISNIPSILDGIVKATESLDSAEVEEIDSAEGEQRGDENAKNKKRKNELNTQFEECVNDFDKLVEKLQDISYNTAILRMPIVNNADYNDNMPSKEKLKDEIKQLYDMFFAMDKKYLEIDEFYTSDSSVEVLKLRALKHLSDSVRNLINIDNYIALLQVMDKSNFYFETPPIQVEGDNVDISIKITAKNDTVSRSIVISSLKGEVIDMAIPTTHKWGISFSTGFMASKLQDFNYGAKTNYGATDTTYSIVQENTGNFVYGPAALMHFAYKFTPCFAAGMHLGVSVPIIENTTPQFMLGASLLIGNKERIGLNFGWALGTVQRLSNATNQSISYKETPTINTKKQTHSAIAFSITYNLPL